MTFDHNHWIIGGLAGGVKSSSSPYTEPANPNFKSPTLPSGSANIIAAWSNYSVTSPDLTLQGISPVINVGSHLTQANGTGTNSTTLIVADATYFQDGTWGSSLASSGLKADWIAIGTVSNVHQISSISGNTITLATPTTWADAANIWLYKKSDGTRVLYGSAPDYGAHEYSGSGHTTTIGSGTQTFTIGGGTQTFTVD
jgi:hypothetical protein